MESLIAWGADVDYDIPHLGTPLYIACISRELQCTQKLLDGGAFVQITKKKNVIKCQPLALYYYSNQGKSNITGF